MRFKKSHGLTSSEQVLAELCEKSFLRLWTYPNLSRKPGKELADLLVVFRDDVLIFSDKSCAFPNTGDPLLDWRRWFRRAIADSARQIHQAEEWIRRRPDQVFLDSRCTEGLPLTLPNPERLRVHRICVVTGAGDRCEVAIGQTSLAIDLNVIDDARPFAIGRVQGIAGWLHVVDGVSLNLLLDRLSTVSDFVAYLDAKSKLFDGGLFQGAPTEADLLAQYLWHGRSFPPILRPFVLRPHLWREVENNARFQAGRRENAVSNFWDGMIEYLTTEYLESTLEFGNELEVSEYEELVRIMASESRFHRRLLSKAILERADRARDAKIGTLLPSEQPDVVYVLLIGRGAQGGDYAAYRVDRSRELQLRCWAAKATRPDCRYFVGIALDARGVRGSSEDFVYLDTKGWTDEVLAGAVRIREEMQYFLPGRAIESRVNEEEYPET
jgi:hypothetical protein